MKEKTIITVLKYFTIFALGVSLGAWGAMMLWLRWGIVEFTEGYSLSAYDRWFPLLFLFYIYLFIWTNLLEKKKD